MLVFEFKAYGKSSRLTAVNEAIRTSQFVRNSCLRYWMDNPKVDKYDLNKYCAVLAKNFPFADELNSQARQASAERAWSAISRFYDNCKKGIPGKKGYAQFQKDCRSVEYKSTGWKLALDKKSIKFTDKSGCSLDRDFNAARNILSRGLGTVGHTETLALNASNALGESTSTLTGEILSEQVGS